MLAPLNSPDELSLLAKCYVIAAARGRALREARERAALEAQADETPATDERSTTITGTDQAGA